MPVSERIVAAKCSVYGCCKPAVSKGFCDTHRKRLERHGHVLQTRPDDWGVRHSHPMYDSWKSLVRKKTPVHEDWKDFWAFVAEVGDRPEGHRLSRVDDTKPLGPGNWYWQSPLHTVEHRIDNAKHQREYIQKRRKTDPWFEFGLSLKRYFGMTVDEYLAMHDAQGGVCAICKQPEKSVHKATGNVRRLAVDHCHAQGHNRALLCSQCNNGLGAFNDNIEVMQAAIEYVRTHRKETA